MRTHRSILFFLLVLAGGVSALHSQGKTFTPEQLTERAEIVAVGRVGTLSSGWSADGKRIHTKVTVMVDRYLKGEQSTNTLTILVPGGEVGEVGETYSHAPRFGQNEHVVVFATRDARGDLRVTGGEQGKFTISETQSAHKMVNEKTSLDELTARVQRAVQRQQMR